MLLGSVSPTEQSLPTVSSSRENLSQAIGGPASPNLNPEYRDTVTISPQAQLLQKVGEESQDRQQELDDNRQADSEEEQTIAQDFVRVSSSVGRAASSFGLSEQQAIELYQKIDNII